MPIKIRNKVAMLTLVINKIKKESVSIREEPTYSLLVDTAIQTIQNNNFDMQQNILHTRTTYNHYSNAGCLGKWETLG